MLSLIHPVYLANLFRSGILLWFLILSPLAFAVNDISARDLFKQPRVAVVGNDSEISIDFSSEIRYVKHSPNAISDTLRISVEIVEPCDAEDILFQQTRWPPKTDWFVAFTATFPEVIRNSGSPTAVCRATRSRVYIAHTLLIKFTKEVSYKVRLGKDKRSIIISTPLIKMPENLEVASSIRTTEPAVEKKVQMLSPELALEEQVSPNGKAVATTVAAASPSPEVAASPPPEAAPSPPPVAGPELAPADLLLSGRTALSSGDNVKAIQMFNRLLNLPQNEYSQEAQELVGLAREKNGEIEKAKAEYELYLNLYPNAEGADRVRKRLAGLQVIKDLPKQAKVQERPKKPIREIHQNTFTGGLSQYYYGGNSQNRIQNATGQVTKTNTSDQSSLINNLSATERFRHNEYDTKIVLRDTYVDNYLTGIVDTNTLSTAYIEHTNKAADYMFRIGRQSGTQGVLGRFDGLFGRYGLNPDWHIVGVIGQPDNGTNSQVETKRKFYGAGLEFGPFAQKWSGGVYGIQMVADGLVERRAVGSELRYFSETTSWFNLLEYDTIYNKVNLAMLQGNWRTSQGYNFNLLVDHRISPIPYAETAIQGQTGARSVSDLLKTLNPDQVYNYVEGLTPTSDLALLGVTKQITERWQLGGDFRYTRTSGTQGAGIVPGQPGSGSIFAYTVQAVGTNTIFNSDTSVIMATLIDDPSYNSQYMSFANSVTLRDKWRLDSTLLYYQEQDETKVKTWKVAPSFHINYFWRDNMSFEAEMTVVRTHTNDPVSATKTDLWNETLFAGYRWDFR